MRQRLISAAVLVPVVVIVFVLGAPWLTLGIALLAALAAYETTRLVQRAGLPSSTALPVVWTPLAVIASAWAAGQGGLAFGLASVASAVAILLMVAAAIGLRAHDPRSGLLAWVGTVIAALHPGLLAFAAAFVGLSPARLDTSIWGYQIDTGRMWLLVLVATVWTLDSAAYLGGKLHGQGRFMNHISPNKTWSGVVAGTAAGVVVCMLLFIGIGLSIVGGILIGLLITITAQLGDLAESMLKRAANAKDSGTLIPGHGGVLDRVDSFLFAAPALYSSIVIIGILRASGVI